MMRLFPLVGYLRLKEEISTGNRRPQHTEEVMFMEHDELSQPGSRVTKTLGIKLDGEQHAQLSMIAQLEELTLADAIRQAIDQWIESKRNNPQLQQRAEAVLEVIEQEAATRRGAIAALLSDEAPKTRVTRARGTSSGRTTQKGGDEASG